MSSEAEGEGQPTAAANVKVESLDPESRQVNVTVKVVSKGEARETVSRRDGSTHRVVDALVGDETGTVLMTFWNENIDLASPGVTLEVKDGYVSFFKGSMRLNVGRYGSITKSESDLGEVSQSNNMSDKNFGEAAYRPRGRFRGRRY